MLMVKKILFCSILLAAAFKPYAQSPVKSVWLSELDLTKMTCVMGTPKIDRSIKGDIMSIGGEKFIPAAALTGCGYTFSATFPFRP